MHRIFCLVLLGIPFLSGCGNPRNLLITEVGKDKIELYLDEDAGNAMSLRSHRLVVTTSSGFTASVPLEAFGRGLNAGEFMIVWEENGYNGLPDAKDFPGGRDGPVPGIRVPDNFFGDLRDEVAAPGAEIRLVGSNSRSGWIIDKVNDVVRCGDVAQRPNTGGSFRNDKSPPLGMPRGSVSVQRLWGTNTRPVDNDRETDWTNAIANWGIATP